jgi:hypothetical protein
LQAIVEAGISDSLSCPIIGNVVDDKTLHHGLTGAGLAKTITIIGNVVDDKTLHRCPPHHPMMNGV